MIRLILAFGLFFLSGCSGSTAPAPYKTANANRLAFIGPRLKAQASTQPAAEQQKVSDVLASWQIEVTAQAK